MLLYESLKKKVVEKLYLETFLIHKKMLTHARFYSFNADQISYIKQRRVFADT